MIEVNNLENKKTSIEANIEKMYKLNGTEKQEINPHQLMISDKDNNLIEIDIIISDNNKITN